MKARRIVSLGVVLSVLSLSSLAWVALPSSALAKQTIVSEIDSAKMDAEKKIRNLLEPLFDKYCNEQCKLMSVNASVDISTPDEVSPGFDEVDPKGVTTITASAATIKILIDEKVGQVSRGKLLDLVQQYLDNLDFPVKVLTQTTPFPQPVGSAGKVVELRERVGKQFKSTIEDLFHQFCPGQCMMADYALQTDVVNAEEAQYDQGGEFVQDSGTAIKIRNISSTILMDDSLSPEVRNNILEMAKLKTNFFKNINISARTMKFPRPTILAADGTVNGIKGDKKTTEDSVNRTLASDSKTSAETKNSETKVTNNSNNNNETSARQERFERIEKIERVENGDAVQAELQKFKVFGLIFACSILSMLIFIALAGFRGTNAKNAGSTVHKVIQSLAADPVSTSAPSTYRGGPEGSTTQDEKMQLLGKRYEAERLLEELMAIFAQQPKVAKQVFTRVLTEEGVETTAQYIHLFGESVVIDMLHDPSLQADINELMEFYAKNPVELTDDDKLELLRKLHNRTVAGKLAVMGSRSSHLFDYLADMDGMQILELIRNESLTVKSIVLTQCDSQKRAAIYSQMDEDSRMKLMAELSRIDYLPRDYIFNVAHALKRKRHENPKLNTEALPGSEVLITLLERTGPQMQRTVIKNLELANPDSARAIKSKLVSLDTLRHLRDGQLLEVVLSLRHDELLQFLKGAPSDVRQAIFTKSPKDLVVELEEELVNVSVLSRESYQAVERKILNRMKLMANDGLINLVETNDRMLSDQPAGPAAGFIEAGPAAANGDSKTASIKKVSGW